MAWRALAVLLTGWLLGGAALAAEGTPSRGDEDTDKIIDEITDEELKKYLRGIPYPQPLQYPEVWWRKDAFGTPGAVVTGVTATDDFFFFSLRCDGEYGQSRYGDGTIAHPFPNTKTPTFYFSRTDVRTFKDGDEELTVQLQSRYWLGSYAVKVCHVKNGASRVAWASPILPNALDRVNRELQDVHGKSPSFSRHGEMLAVEWRADNPRVDKLDAFPEDAAPWDWIAPLLPEIAFLNLFDGRFDIKFRVAERFMRHVPASEIAEDGTLALTVAPKDVLCKDPRVRERMVTFAFVSSDELPPFIRWSLIEIFGGAFPERHVGHVSFHSTRGHSSYPPYKEYHYLACRTSLFLRLREGETVKLRQATEKGLVRIQEFPKGCFVRFPDTVFWYDPRLKFEGDNQLFRIERRRFTGGTDELFPTYGPWSRQQEIAAKVGE